VSLTVCAGFLGVKCWQLRPGLFVAAWSYCQLDSAL
jgi:hypothetical protein